MAIPADQNKDNVKLAHEWVRKFPPVLTCLALFLFATGTVITAGADIGTVCFAMKQRYVDAFGHFSGSWFELIAISCMTLCGYFAIGMLWKKGYKFPAVAMYLVILILLALSLASTETSRFQDAWNSAASSGGNVFSGQTGGSDNVSSGAPGWFLVGCDILFAFCLTIAGLLFIVCKDRLAKCLKEFKHMKIMSGVLEHDRQRIAREDAVHELETLSASRNNPEFKRRLVTQASAQVLNRQSAKVLVQRSQASAVLQSVRSSAADKYRAQTLMDKAQECLDAIERLRNPSFAKKAGGTVMMLLLLLGVCGFSTFANAQSTAELCRTAPVFQLLLDASGSSPAQDPNFISAAEPLIEEKLRSMPMCSQVMVVTVGDASTMPAMLRTRIQVRTTRDGATVNDIAAALRRFLSGFPDRIKGHEQGRSELIGSLADASHNLNQNATAPNVIIVLSDMIENSGLANCETRACRLPGNPALSLANVSVTVYGAGLGLPSARALALTKAWEQYLNRAGATADLHRTF